MWTVPMKEDAKTGMAACVSTVALLLSVRRRFAQDASVAEVAFGKLQNGIRGRGGGTVQFTPSATSNPSSERFKSTGELILVFRASRNETVSALG